MCDEMKRNWDFLRDGPEEVHRGDLIGSPIMRNCEIEMYRQWDARLRRVEAMLEKLTEARLLWDPIFVDAEGDRGEAYSEMPVDTGKGLDVYDEASYDLSPDINEN